MERSKVTKREQNGCQGKKGGEAWEPTENRNHKKLRGDKKRFELTPYAQKGGTLQDS